MFTAYVSQYTSLCPLCSLPSSELPMATGSTDTSVSFKVQKSNFLSMSSCIQIHHEFMAHMLMGMEYRHYLSVSKTRIQGTGHFARVLGQKLQYDCKTITNILKMTTVFLRHTTQTATHMLKETFLCIFLKHELN